MDRLHADSKTAREASVCGMSHNPSNIISVLVNHLSFILFTYLIKLITKYLKPEMIKNDIVDTLCYVLIKIHLITTHFLPRKYKALGILKF